MKVTMKSWRIAESYRCGITEQAVSMRVTRGKYRGKISIRRKNARVVFVTEL